MISHPSKWFGRTSRLALAVVVLTLGIAQAAQAQKYLMMPDSSASNTMVLFSPVDGSVVNPSYFPLAGGTPVHAMQVGDEIWLSEQIGDRVSRWSITGTPLGQVGGGPSGGLDNVRGMGLIGSTVYVTNSGTNNTAPGNAVVMFDTAGNPLGNFSTVGLAPSPFGILPHQGGMLVASSSANDDIHRFSLTGTPLGTFHNSTSLNFAEQMDYATNGDVLVAGFSSNNIARLDASTGNLLATYPASGARGVFQLSNGNIMWTNGSGAHVLDPTTGASVLVYSGSGRFLDLVEIPEPGCGLMLAAAGLLALKRRRMA
jgi:hypothetical protein